MRAAAAATSVARRSSRSACVRCQENAPRARLRPCISTCGGGARACSGGAAVSGVRARGPPCPPAARRARPGGGRPAAAATARTSPPAASSLSARCPRRRVTPSRTSNRPARLTTLLARGAREGRTPRARPAAAATPAPPLRPARAAAPRAPARPLPLGCRSAPRRTAGRRHISTRTAAPSSRPLSAPRGRTPPARARPRPTPWRRAAPPPRPCGRAARARVSGGGAAAPPGSLGRASRARPVPTSAHARARQ